MSVALNELLSSLRIRGSVYFCDFLSPPWALEHTQEKRALFHLVRRGRCVLEVEGRKIDLLPGEFVFVSPGVDHRVDAFPDDAADTLLLCGYSLFDAQRDNLLLRDMAPYIVITQDQLQTMPWVQRTLEHLSSEYLSDAISTELTVNKLTEILIIQLIQSEFGEKRRAGVIAALRDKRLARALDRIHENLQDHWTIAKAAHHANMSRSGFARVFTQLIGLSFYEYLTQIRIQRARSLLLESSQRVADIAMMVGYQSELSFVKVFKKRSGMTPRAFRLGAKDD